MIYIVRHGKTDWNQEGRIMGRTDIPLNEVGKKEARKVAKELENIEFAAVFSSPLKRTYETAKIICPNKNIIVDNRLIERNNGKLEGMLKENIKDVKDFSSYNLEPVEIIQKRVDDFLKDILPKYKGKNILVVTHGGVSINVRCFFEGEPEDQDISKYRLQNCEVVIYSND